MTNRLIAAFCALLCLSLAAPATAGPWLDAGDRQARNDVELLKSAGLMPGPVNAWPLSWRQVDVGLRIARQDTRPPHIEAAIARLEALSERALQSRRVEAEVRLTTDPSLTRDFEDSARENVDVSGKVEFDMGRLTVAVGGGYREGQDGSDFHAEESYAALALGEWALYGGYVERWWGPGQDSALLFSNNARPIPQIGITKLSADPIDFPVLRLLGPFKFDAFVGVLAEERQDFDNPVVMGFRAAFEPVRGLEIGVNRGLQLCGEGRRCDAKIIGRALFPFGGAENTAGISDDEPGNQLGGFDASYTFLAGGTGIKVYTEWEAEDEAGIFLLDRFVRLFGATASGAIGDAGANWQVNVEYTDTLLRAYFDANDFLSGRPLRGRAYTNIIFTDGYTYRGHTIGASIGGDSDLLTVGGSYTDSTNHRYYAAFRMLDLNKTSVNEPSYRTRFREKITFLTVGALIPTYFGDISGELRWRDDQPDTPGSAPSAINAELSWRSRF
ncbi:hypothetical protein KCG44_12375 [Pacificimonas sp. WHA3]|uniref:Capsule assembly Wzi family protein n=1 Tax=Pacificimonas pallii TaxID=2827236 RepID=A0ABS6SH58_9SPHN|nr:capsule assembly Wzi family protein [Pacificimonas pallii]MBV7257580.1 hypothetical protein [Pacificimonas pallii]